MMTKEEKTANDAFAVIADLIKDDHACRVLMSAALSERGKSWGNFQSCRKLRHLKLMTLVPLTEDDGHGHRLHAVTDLGRAVGTFMYDRKPRHLG